MTALPLEPHTEAEEATLERIEGAEPAEESAVEKVARALAASDAVDYDYYLTGELGLRETYRRNARAAIEALKGPSPAEAALARVEALADEYGWVGGSLPAQHVADSLSAAIAAPVAQASGTEQGR